jgi:hypothetical protein
MKFSVDLDISGAVKLTNVIAKQIPFAMAKALTQTAIPAQTDTVQAGRAARVTGVSSATSLRPLIRKCRAMGRA